MVLEIPRSVGAAFDNGLLSNYFPMQRRVSHDETQGACVPLYGSLVS